MFQQTAHILQTFHKVCAIGWVLWHHKLCTLPGNNSQNLGRACLSFSQVGQWILFWHFHHYLSIHIYLIDHFSTLSPFGWQSRSLIWRCQQDSMWSQLLPRGLILAPHSHCVHTFPLPLTPAPIAAIEEWSTVAGFSAYSLLAPDLENKSTSSVCLFYL